MIILGIGGLLGDAAAAVLNDGELAAAVEESKLVRRRTHWGGLDEMPEHAISTCLELAGAKPEQVDAVAVVRPIPESDFHLKLRARVPISRIIVVEHHLAHAASAYYPSPFEEATVLTLDRAGDFRCGTRWHATGTQLALERELYQQSALMPLSPWLGHAQPGVLPLPASGRRALRRSTRRCRPSPPSGCATRWP